MCLFLVSNLNSLLNSKFLILFQFLFGPCKWFFSIKLYYTGSWVFIVTCLYYCSTLSLSMARKTHEECILFIFLWGLLFVLNQVVSWGKSLKKWDRKKNTPHCKSTTYPVYIPLTFTRRPGSKCSLFSPLIISWRNNSPRRLDKKKAVVGHNSGGSVFFLFLA